MARKSYVLDGIEIKEESSFGGGGTGSALTTFGHIKSCVISVEEDVNRFKPIQGAATSYKVNRHIYLLHKPKITLTFHPIDLKWMKYALGNYAESAPNYTVASQATLPTTLAIKGNYDGTDGLHVRGVCFGVPKLNISEGNIVTITITGEARDCVPITESISYTTPSIDPLTYLDGVFTYNSNQYLITNLDIEMDLKLKMRRSVEAYTSGNRRKYSEAIRTGFGVVKLSGVAELQDIDTEYVTHIGHDTAIQDAGPSTFNATLALTDANGDAHTLTISTVSPLTFEQTVMGNEDDVKTFTFTAEGLDASVSGVI